MSSLGTLPMDNGVTLHEELLAILEARRPALLQAGDDDRHRRHGTDRGGEPSVADGELSKAQATCCYTTNWDLTLSRRYRLSRPFMWVVDQMACAYLPRSAVSAAAFASRTLTAANAVTSSSIDTVRRSVRRLPWTISLSIE